MTNPFDQGIPTNDALSYNLPSWLVSVYLEDNNSDPVPFSGPAFCFNISPAGPGSAITVTDANSISFSNASGIVTPASTLGSGILSAIKTYLEGADYDSYSGTLGGTTPYSVTHVYVTEYTVPSPSDITP